MIELDRKAFTNNFAAVAACVPNRTTKDILKNVLLVSDGSTFTLSATDGELHMASTCAAPTGDSVKALLPAARVLAILREVESETVKLDLSANGVTGITITCGQAKFTLAIEDCADFPPVPTFNADAWFAVVGDELRKAIRRTIFNTDPESTRYALGGIKFEVSQSGALLIATDSRRLSVAPIAVAAVNNPDLPTNSPVVPARAMKLLEQSTGDAHIACTENGISFQCGHVTISSQLVQGRFPDWRKVVPDNKSFTRRVMLPVGQFASIVRQASILRTEESRGIDLVFAKDTLTVTSGKNELGSAKASMPITLDGEPITITFDSKYVLEVLKVLGNDVTIEIAMVADDDRGLITAGDYKHVIMPLARE